MKGIIMILCSLLMLTFTNSVIAQEVRINTNMKVEADGTLIFEDSATVYDDLRVTLDKGVNSTAVVFDYFSGSTGPQIWFFKNTNSVAAMSFTVQMPHNWKEGTTIYPHLHWTPKASDSGNIEWNFDYTWANYNPTSPVVFPAITTSTVVSSGPFVGNSHTISSLTVNNAGLNATGKHISSILVCRLWRDASDADDTYAADAGMLFVDFHYQVDALGSRTTFTK